MVLGYRATTPVLFVDVQTNEVEAFEAFVLLALAEVGHQPGGGAGRQHEFRREIRSADRQLLGVLSVDPHKGHRSMERHVRVDLQEAPDDVLGCQ